MTRKKVDNNYIGPVFITKGTHQGRIGFCDDIASLDFINKKSRKRIKKITKQEEDLAIRGKHHNIEAICYAAVYFGEMVMSLDTLTYIPFEDLEIPSIDDLFARYTKLANLISKYRLDEDVIAVFDLYAEYDYVKDLLNDIAFDQRHHAQSGKKVFLSHSSKDKPFVRMIHDELKIYGHTPWLDEYQIKVGDSIVEKLNRSLSEIDFVILILTKNAIDSKWVEREWMSKYWDEIRKNKVIVLPALKEDCEIPTLLRDKKFADFRTSYNKGFYEILAALA